MTRQWECRYPLLPTKVTKPPCPPIYPFGNCPSGTECLRLQLIHSLAPDRWPQSYRQHHSTPKILQNLDCGLGTSVQLYDRRVDKWTALHKLVNAHWPLVSAHCISFQVFTLLFFPSSSVSLSYFILAVSLLC